MKKFIFSLQKVLDFKQQTLDVKKNELSMLQMKLSELEKEIEGFNEKFSSSNRNMLVDMQNGITAKDIAIYKMYLQSLNQKIIILTEERRKRMDVILQKQTDIVQINSEISGLEKLKEKQLDSYTKDRQKSEELAIEEFIVQGRSAAI